MTLRTKVLLPLVFFSALLAGYLYGYWMPLSLETLRGEYRSATERHLDSVAEGLTPLLLARQLDTIHENLDALRDKNRDWTGIELDDAQGRSLYPLNSASSPAANGAGGYVHVLKKQIDHLGLDLGVLTIRVDFSPWLAPAEKRQRELAAILLSVIAAFFVSAGFLLDRLVVRPVNALSQTASELSQGRFDGPLAKCGDDEVGNLVDRFAQMRDAIRGYQADLLKRSEVLKKSKEEVLRLNAELEERVAARTAALEQANKELESFSYSVSHDLRAPLRAIDGFSRILQEEYDEVLGEDGRRYTGTITKNAVRMGQLISDILDFSRMSRSEIAAAPVDMTGLAREVYQEVRDAASAERNIVLRMAGLPAASGDLALLRQVWVNLLSNAVKYSGPRAEAVIEVGSSVDGGENTYWVKDNGVGFDMRYMDKLFGVFQRLHSAEEFEGTGIGLAIVKRIVTRHGGRVWAESKPGEGTAIYFILPAERVEQVPA